MADDTSSSVTFLAHEIEYCDLDSIEPHPDNPNEGDVGAIAESVDEVGFVDPIVVQLSSRRILSGEHRWLTLKALGETTGPMIFIDVDDATALRYLIGANEIARRRSRIDDDAVSKLLVDLQQSGGGVRGTGYDDDDVDALLNRISGAHEGSGGGSAPSPNPPPERTIPVGVGFRFGDYSGWVSQPVYEKFRDAYEQQRETSEEVLLDDVLAAWLDL